MWGSELGGKYETLPKEGQEKVFHVKKIEKVEEANSEWNFKSKKHGNLGYRYVFTLMDGKQLTVGNFGAATAMKKAGVDDGSKFLIKHTGREAWECSLVTDKIAWE